MTTKSYLIFVVTRKLRALFGIFPLGIVFSGSLPSLCIALDIYDSGKSSVSIYATNSFSMPEKNHNYSENDPGTGGISISYNSELRLLSSTALSKRFIANLEASAERTDKVAHGCTYSEVGDYGSSLEFDEKTSNQFLLSLRFEKLNIGYGQGKPDTSFVPESDVKRLDRSSFIFCRPLLFLGRKKNSKHINLGYDSKFGRISYHVSLEDQSKLNDTVMSNMYLNSIVGEFSLPNLGPVLVLEKGKSRTHAYHEVKHSGVSIRDIFFNPSSSVPVSFRIDLSRSSPLYLQSYSFKIFPTRKLVVDFGREKVRQRHYDSTKRRAHSVEQAHYVSMQLNTNSYMRFFMSFNREEYSNRVYSTLFGGVRISF